MHKVSVEGKRYAGGAGPRGERTHTLNKGLDEGAGAARLGGKGPGAYGPTPKIKGWTKGQEQGPRGVRTTP